MVSVFSHIPPFFSTVDSCYTATATWGKPLRFAFVKKAITAQMHYRIEGRSQLSGLPCYIHLSAGALRYKAHVHLSFLFVKKNVLCCSPRCSQLRSHPKHSACASVSNIKQKVMMDCLLRSSIKTLVTRNQSPCRYKCLRLQNNFWDGKLGD